MMPQVALDGNTNVPIVFRLWSLCTRVLH